jgi:hypothetical protein
MEINYKVIDNFLPKAEFNEIKNTLMSDMFPWFYNDNKVSKTENVLFEDGEDGSKYNFQFTHTFYGNMYPQSNYCFELFSPMLEIINPKALVRIKSNLTPPTPKKIIYGYHTDLPNTPKNLKTAVYYVNTNDGLTLFKDGPTVESVENRLLIFDSDLLHTGTSSTDISRCVVNLNFFE